MMPYSLTFEERAAALGRRKEQRMEPGAFSISLAVKDNPGWDSNASKLDTFTDVRDLQRQLKAQGVQLMTEADETTTGPASFVVVDPDGNPILVDQHV
jgi:uncharacterized glyoxalase superfamily protein PhnB